MAIDERLDRTMLMGATHEQAENGLIPAVKPYTHRLLDAGAWYSPEVVDRVLAGVDK